MVEAVERASGINVTHLVVNSHLIEETSAAVIEEGVRLAEAVQEEMGSKLGLWRLSAGC